MTATITKSLFLGRLHEIISRDYCGNGPKALGRMDDIYRDTFTDYAEPLNDPNIPGSHLITIYVPDDDIDSHVTFVNELAEAACVRITW